MSYFENTQRKAIEPSYVDQEGDYQVKITGYDQGTLEKDGITQRYTRVTCLVNYKTRPSISIFLTEGKSFDGNFTAFCDTFGIVPEMSFDQWIGKKGYVHIMLKKKDGFTNMVPRWILNEQGYVMDEVKAAANKDARQQQPSQAPQAQQPYGNYSNDDLGDIPF